MKQGRFFKRAKLPCIAFASVGALYLLYYALFGFYPFGERSIAWCDMEQQYVPLLMELRGILRDGGSVLLGRGGGGMNLWGVLLFFVSSPLGLLSLTVSGEKMIYFINLLTVLKLAFCGASASFYFGRLFRGMSGGFNVLLSVMYSFSGYVMMYYQNNMWLDMMIIFPLLLLSMFRLCERGRWRAYAALLSLAMFMNFYISYMIVLFIVVSFGAMLIFCCKRELRVECAVKFIAADVCAALITAVVWLPSLKQFSSSGRGESTLELFRRGAFFENWQDKLALLSCTSVIFAAVVIMLFRRRLFSSGRAAFFAVTTLILLAGALVSPVNKLWHTGSYQAYPLRYGFIIVLFGLSICAVLLSDNMPCRNISRKATAAVTAAFAVFIIAAVPVIALSGRLSSYVDSLWVKGTDAAAAIGFGALGAVVYAVLIQNYRSGRIGCRFAVFLMAGVMLCESLLSFGVYIGNARDVTARFKQTVELSGKIDDDDFFRVKSMKRYFYSNMLEAMGYNSIGHYTSLTDSEFLFTAKRLGYSSYWLDSSSNGGTMVTDAFLVNKYLVGADSDMNAFAEPYDTDGILKVYRNTAVSGGAVISGTSPEELVDFRNTERMESSVYIAEKLYGAENILRKIEPYACQNLILTDENGVLHCEIEDKTQEAFLSFSFFADGTQELYFDLFGIYSTALTEDYFGAVSVSVNGKQAEEDFPSKRSSGILDLGTFSNKYVSVRIDVHKDFAAGSFGVYLLDAGKTAEYIAAAQTGKIALSGNKIRITAESSGGWVYLPFAYSEGFSAKLNGSKAEIHRVLGSFMAVELEGGENELVLTYYPEGFIAGIVLSGLGAALYIAAAFAARRVPISGKMEKAAYRAVLLMSTAAFALIYIFSAAAWIVLQLTG